MDDRSTAAGKIASWQSIAANERMQANVAPSTGDYLLLDHADEATLYGPWMQPIPALTSVRLAKAWSTVTSSPSDCSADRLKVHEIRRRIAERYLDLRSGTRCATREVYKSSITGAHYLVSDPTKVWIGLEYFCYETDDLWKMEDARR